MSQTDPVHAGHVNIQKRNVHGTLLLPQEEELLCVTALADLNIGLLFSRPLPHIRFQQGKLGRFVIADYKMQHGFSFNIFLSLGDCETVSC